MSKSRKKPQKNGQGGRREGAGRKVDPDVGYRVPLGVSVPETLIEDLDSYAAEKEITRSRATEILLRAALEIR